MMICFECIFQTRSQEKYVGLIVIPTKYSNCKTVIPLACLRKAQTVAASKNEQMNLRNLTDDVHVIKEAFGRLFSVGSVTCPVDVGTSDYVVQSANYTRAYA